VSSDIRAGRLSITFRFAHTFLTAASLRTSVRCFVNLDQLDDLAVSSQRVIPISDSIKRLALPNVVCEVNSIMYVKLYDLLKRVSFSQSISQSPNVSPNDQHLFAYAAESTTAEFAPTT